MMARSFTFLQSGNGKSFMSLMLRRSMLQSKLDLAFFAPSLQPSPAPEQPTEEQELHQSALALAFSKIVHSSLEQHISFDSGRKSHGA